MSGNKKYIDEFNKNAGTPADFDSLFTFKKDQLIAKRRIRMKKNNGKLAFMVSSAAVIIAGAVFGLTYLDSRGITPDGDIDDLSDVIVAGDCPTDETEGQADIRLSDIYLRYDYALSANKVNSSEYANDTMKSLESANAVVDGRVVSKYLRDEDDGTQKIIYIIYPLQYFYEQSFSFEKNSDNDGCIIVESDYELTSSFSELMTGSEYVIPLAIEGDGNDRIYKLLAPSDMQIRLTEYGWIMNSEYAEIFNADVPVNNDVFINSPKKYFAYSDIQDFRTEIMSYFEKSSKKYYFSSKKESIPEAEYHIPELFDDDSGKLRFEGYGDDGYTVLLKSDEEMISVMNGEVIYSGKSIYDDNLCVVAMDNEMTAVIYWAEESHALIETTVTGTDTGVFGGSKAFFRVFDDHGYPVKLQVGISSDSDTASVSLIE